MQKINLENLAQTLLTDRNIIAAWLFGSARDGEVSDRSDLDIGVLFQSKPGLDELSDLRAAVQEELQLEEIDLVVLNDSSPILRFEALSGRLLCSRDDGKRAEFASLSAREYEDAVAMSRRHLKAAREAGT